MNEIHGMYAAAVTPFDAHGVFQPVWQAEHFAWLQEHGIDGVLVAGTNGEGPSLSADERRTVIDAAVQNRGGLQLIAGTGTPSLSETIGLSRYALEAGVDAVLVVPPYYFRNAPENGLIRYYRALCNALPPSGRLLFYHIPPVSGVPISHGLINSVLRSNGQQCYGLKDTGGNPAETRALAETFPNLCVMGGNDHFAAANLQAGVRGQISGLANAVPELLVGLFRAWQAQEPLDPWQDRINVVRELLQPYPQHAAIKALASLRADLPAISVKPPLVELESEQRQQLQHDVGALRGV